MTPKTFLTIYFTPDILACSQENKIYFFFVCILDLIYHISATDHVSQSTTKIITTRLQKSGINARALSWFGMDKQTAENREEVSISKSN